MMSKGWRFETWRLFFFKPTDLKPSNSSLKPRYKHNTNCDVCRFIKAEAAVFTLFSVFFCPLEPENPAEWLKKPVAEQEDGNMWDRSREQEVHRETIRWESEAEKSKLLQKQGEDACR